MKPDFKRFLLPPGTFSKPSVLVIIFSICFAFWFLDFWKSYNTAKGEHNFHWDVMNYYSYLPATFCNDGSFDFHQGPGRHFLPWGPLGTFVPKTTYGMSLLYAPYFAMGYKIAYNQRSPLDGFSEPFATCIHWGSIFYVIFGLMFLRKFLLAYFSEMVVALTLFLILFGTMLFMYTYTLGELAHGHLFMLFSAFLLLTQRWHQHRKYSTTVWLGIVLGLISLIRPTEIFIFAFFILWNVKGFTDLKAAVVFFGIHFRHLLVIFLMAVLLWIPQFLFWKQHAGTYFYFSYPDERFFWNDPQIINILFSYRKGWITYTPLVILSFAGFFFVKPNVPISKWFFLFITAGMVYVLSCWWDWFFGGCFGARGFCQHIAYLAIPLASFIEFVFFSPKKSHAHDFLGLITGVFMFSCVCLNLGQTYQYLHNRIHFDGMTKKVYWDVFRKYKYEDAYEYQYWGDLDSPQYDKMRSGEDRNQ